MINIKPDVRAALETVCDNVVFYFPKTFKNLPCISYYEINNAPSVFADDGEYTADILYTVDVWDKGSDGVSALALLADGALAAAGFMREFAADVYNPDSSVRHKTMRFKLII